MTAADLLKRAKHCEACARNASSYDGKKAWLEDAKEWRRQAAKLTEKERADGR